MARRATPPGLDLHELSRTIGGLVEHARIANERLDRIEEGQAGQGREIARLDRCLARARAFWAGVAAVAAIVSAVVTLVLQTLSVVGVQAAELVQQVLK